MGSTLLKTVAVILMIGLAGWVHNEACKESYAQGFKDSSDKIHQVKYREWYRAKQIVSN